MRNSEGVKTHLIISETAYTSIKLLSVKAKQISNNKQKILKKNNKTT